MPNRTVRALGRAVGVGVLMAALVAGSGGTASGLTIAPTDGYGFSVGAPQSWMSPEDAERELDAAALTGSSWMRVLIDWHVVEPTRGQYNWDYVDRWINGSTARNMRVLGLIAYTPDWARAPGTYFSAPPVNPADFAAFVATVVTRYADRVSSWEIWNEPNIPTFFGFSDTPAEKYTQLLKAAYPAIKAVQPASTVVAAGLSPAFDEEAATLFLSTMYASGVGGYFDAAALHPYVYPGGLATEGRNGWSDVAVIHQIMADNGDGDKKIWLTEMGASTSDPAVQGVSQEEQARQIIGVLAAAAATEYSGPAFIYCIRDENTSDQGSLNDNFGALLTTNFQPKIAAAMLAR